MIVKDKSKLPTEDRRTADTIFDRIYKFYHHNKTRVKLSSEEERIRDRWERAWLLMTRHRTRKQTVDILVKVCNISQSLAFDDVRHAMMLFGTPEENTKDAKRAIAETMALKGADKSWKDGDMDAYHKFLKIYMNLNHLYDENANGVADLLKKIKPHQVVIVSSEAELVAQANALQKELIKDIPHKEVE